MRNGRARDRGNSLMRAAVTLGLAVAVALVLPAGVLRAQLPPLKPAHLNPMIEKLAAGKAVFGPIISDLSMTNARTWARSDADYVWIDMEHNPLNMEAVAHFIAFSNDRSYTVKRGDGQPKLALVARFPPYASENAAWVAKTEKWMADEKREKQDRFWRESRDSARLIANAQMAAVRYVIKGKVMQRTSAGLLISSVGTYTESAFCGSAMMCE